tara:strand:+ start:779 stop:1312 length:534 start_codon:yes stop_codon:yes gene_type:complete
MAAVLGTVGGLAALGSTATGVGMLGSAKMQSGAAGRAAQVQTQAANRAAELQRQTAQDQLAYTRNQARIDRESKQWADRQNYGLSRAQGMNDFYRFGDNEFNTRASELSRGRTEDRRYGENQKQYNTMRRLMGMPNKALSVYVEPEALRLTAPVVPDYVEDPTDFSDPNDPNKNRLV